MRPTLFAAALTGALLAAGSVLAQTPAPAAPPADILFTPSAQAMALLAKAKSELKAPATMAPAQPLLRGPGMRAVVEYRSAPTPASVHETQGEFFYVLDGSGSLTVGGTMTAPTRTNPTNLNGAGITGGETRTLAKGDFVFVPAGVAHYFASVGPNGIGVVTLKVDASKPAT